MSEDRPRQTVSPESSTPPPSRTEAEWVLYALSQRLDAFDKRFDGIDEKVGEIQGLVNQVRGGLRTLTLVLAGAGVVVSLALIITRALNVTISFGD